MPSRFTLAASTAALSLLALALPAPLSAKVVVSAQPASPPISLAEMRDAIPADAAAADTGAVGPAQLAPGATAAISAASGARRSAAKLAGAQPLAGETELPHRAHGRIFFQKAGDESSVYSCSGTVVRSRLRNLVFTAGHCVYDLEAAAFNERITFVPAYREGQMPFGLFPATERFVTSGWISGAGTGYDVGAITVEAPLQDQLGARPIDFEFEARPGSRLAIYGYPAQPNPPYDGERPIVCDAAIVNSPYSVDRPPSLAAAPCDMRQGSSGGGWIDGNGRLVSVVSHGYCDSEPKACGFIFGPRLAASGAKIYESAGGAEKPTLTVVSGPRGSHPSSRAVFRFHATASTPVRLLCRLTSPTLKGRLARAFRPCGKRRVYRRLRPGRYRLDVRLSDQTGRRAKAKRFFRVPASVKAA